MSETSRRATTTWASLAAITFVIAPALAQAPPEAHRAAIKSQCRSDYMAHCSSVPPGGAPALQCLQNNITSLSSSCQSAVRAAEASVEKPEPKADARPESAPAAAAAAKPATEPA